MKNQTRDKKRRQRHHLFALCTDTLQRADYLSYEQFAVAFDTDVKTVRNRVSEGKYPVERKKFPGPRIDMRAFREKFKLPHPNVDILIQSHTLLEEHLNGE